MNLADVSGGNVASPIPKGSAEYDTASVHKIVERVGPYIVTILLDELDRFTRIESISVDKSFLSIDQSITKFKYLDIEQFLENVE